MIMDYTSRQMQLFVTKTSSPDEWHTHLSIQWVLGKEVKQLAA
jgi:hypothetical protein